MARFQTPITLHFEPSIGPQLAALTGGERSCLRHRFGTMMTQTAEFDCDYIAPSMYVFAFCNSVVTIMCINRRFSVTTIEPSRTSFAA